MVWSMPSHTKRDKKECIWLMGPQWLNIFPHFCAFLPPQPSQDPEKVLAAPQHDSRALNGTCMAGRQHESDPNALVLLSPTPDLQHVISQYGDRTYHKGTDLLWSLYWDVSSFWCFCHEDSAQDGLNITAYFMYFLSCASSYKPPLESLSAISFYHSESLINM